FEDPGTYFVELNVTVEAGNYDKDIIIVWVKDTTDPVADAGQNWTIYTDQKVELNGSESYDNYRISRYEWQIGNEVYYGETIIHEFSKVGEFKVTLKVIDDAGNIDTDPIYVTVKDGKKPTADAGEDSVVVVDEEVMLNGKHSSDNVGIENYTWTIVEKNEVVYGESAIYEFEESGTYTVRLTVSDENNNIDHDSIKIEVEEKEEPLSFFNILLPIIIFVLALVSLFIFFYTNESKKDSKKEIKKDEEEKTTEEEGTEDISREEIVSKLESGELTPKQLEELMAESQKKMRKDIAEIYQYLEVLRSKARQYREGKAKESKEEEESKQQEDKVSSEPEKESEPQEQKPTEPQEAPPELDEMPDEGEENMENMMKQLEDMDDSEAPDGFPTPDDEEPPSLEDAAETGDISQDDIDDLFH
ncbi:MAG: PKD domain-containing protein, partial [Thermoplasmatota archaeon]